MHSRQLLTWDQRLKSREKHRTWDCYLTYIKCYIIYSFTKVRSLHLCQAQCCMSMDGVVSISITICNMAILLGLNWLAILLYMEAVVSPLVLGFCCRYYGKNGHIPKFLGKINKSIISTCCHCI